MRVPSDPAIYHITHIRNLAGIVAAGRVFSLAACDEGAATPLNIGYSHIKLRRRTRPVPCAVGGCLGDYVPFNFCNRSVMLYVVSRGHTGYGGGEREIVHLCSTVRTAIAGGQPWAFTDRHAEVAHALYYDDLAALGEVDWPVMGVRFWNEPQVKAEKRQAEFLAHQYFDWRGILHIGCFDQEIVERVRAIVGPDGPSVSVRRDWYYT